MFNRAAKILAVGYGVKKEHHDKINTRWLERGVDLLMPLLAPIGLCTGAWSVALSRVPLTKQFTDILQLTGIGQHCSQRFRAQGIRT